MSTCHGEATCVHFPEFKDNMTKLSPSGLVTCRLCVQLSAMISSGSSYINQRSPKLLLGDRWRSRTQKKGSKTHTICSTIETARLHLEI